MAKEHNFCTFPPDMNFFVQIPSKVLTLPPTYFIRGLDNSFQGVTDMIRTKRKKRSERARHADAGPCFALCNSFLPSFRPVDGQ